MSIQEKFSVQRTYIIVRTLGLRHLTVVNDHNHVVGIITRKDLMGFNLQEKVSKVLNNELRRRNVQSNSTEIDGPNHSDPGPNHSDPV